MNLKQHLFLALPIPDLVKQQIHTGCLQMQESLTFKKWVYPSDYHITLKFLGGVERNTVEKIKPLAEQITSNQTPYSLVIEGLHTFGKIGAPRILWAGVGGGLVSIATLQRNIDKSMESLGFIVENRPYQPHVTLAKNYIGKSEFGVKDKERAFTYMPEPSPWLVTEVVLYQTHLGRERMYEAVETFPFLVR